MTFHPFYVVNPLALACPLKNGTSSKTVATGRDGGSQTAKKHSRCFSLFKEVQPSETKQSSNHHFSDALLFNMVIQNYVIFASNPKLLYISEWRPERPSNHLVCFAPKPSCRRSYLKYPKTAPGKFGNPGTRNFV